ncbi:hypothetical protein [Planomonospora venezuelensis]|uniref:Uncharacterized protein n=1 Tax=Planomonospora venezuelensis TaxID=1999 RepID=A0A841D4M2_PLAVE|nr:hypothetical protein [Planomonospora venezuelensis]MBB5963328.1 hypothetical protein [Planomonospora venezuelensis]GIN02734.1 hypothetical protein Pve01_43920 [Planomonospora venezuelensis]
MRSRPDDHTAAPSIRWWRRWGSWPGSTASGAAAVYGCVLLVAALTGYRSFLGVTDLGLPDVTWPGAAVLLTGSVVAAATVRPWGVRVPPGAVSAGAWGVAALALTGSCWVLLNLIQLVLTGTVTDRHGNSDWVTFAERLCLAVVGALFVATALAHARRSAGVCPRCGRAHSPQVAGRRHPVPHAAPPAVRRIAYAGCCAFLPYLTLHALGAAGVPGIEPGGFRPTWSMVLAGVCGVGLAVFLLLGLVRPWGMVFPRWTLWLAGRRVPRFLPLAPVWLLAPTLALYGTGSGVLAGAGILGDGLFGIGGAASLAFGGYGWALAIAAVSYQSRTRPVCVPREAIAP